jgi:signal transduction histidine kinase
MMWEDFRTGGMAELAPAILQATITVLLAVLCWYLYQRYRKPYFAWWAVAWAVFTLRIGAIITFLSTGQSQWLYWHQVMTGLTALALLWAALVFSRQLTWRWRYVPIVLFPVVWSYVAVYQLNNFLLAAGPAVLFLSGATFWTGWVFWRQQRLVGGTGVGLLAWGLMLWGINHLNYPFLRARGVLNPWSYYLDILFELSIGAGILVAVQDDLRRGLMALSTLSGDLQSGRDTDDVLDRLLERPLTLPAVNGSALFMNQDAGDGSGEFVRGRGVCLDWEGQTPRGQVSSAIERAKHDGRPQVISSDASLGTGHEFGAFLPVLRGAEVTGVLVLVGSARDPFTALDEGFLAALGQQVGAALENADLYHSLQQRNEQLARLSSRMVEQHEEERRRLRRELHDETAQVFSAVRMELGVIRQQANPQVAQSLDHVLALTDTGIRSIRNVTHRLRPSLLDDLGLAPALRSLASEFGERAGLSVDLETPQHMPALSKDAELALFRAMQEALSNVLRHAQATLVHITVREEANALALTIRDDGRGPATDPSAGGMEHMGLTGMQERIGALGGTVTLDAPADGGFSVTAAVPLTTGGETT